MTMFAEHERAMPGSKPLHFVQDHPRSALDASLGIVLIVIGAMFFAQQFLGFNLWRWSWPLILVVPGVAFLLAAFAMGRGASGLAIPGMITTTVGLLLLIQNTFNLWYTWAYAWALIVPTSIGLGIWLHGWLSGKESVQRTGRTMTIVGAWIFVGFATFFELVLKMGDRFGRGIGGLGVAIVLILAGAFLLMRPSDRTTM